MLRAATEGNLIPANGEGVAIIGSGPAGLSAAHDLALLGFTPVVFELEPVAAGMLAVGVPEYRLPRELIRREVAVIEALGVKIRSSTKVGEDVSFRSLREDFSAVIIAVGAKRPRALGLPGEQGPGVYGGVDFLRAVALGESLSLGSDVVVIGGGNVAYDVARSVVRQAAYDAARVAARLSATRRVRLVSLETLEEMPADTVEIREGEEEGIERLSGWGPVAIRRGEQGNVVGLEIKQCLRVYDEQKRFAPQFDETNRLILDCDTILIAAGQAPDLSFLEEGGNDIDQFRPGWPKVDPLTLMPELGLTEQQIDQLTFYMLSLRGRNFQEALWPKDRIRAERFGVREFSTDGATLYGTYCAACHGAKGEGMRYPGLSAFPAIGNPNFLRFVSDDFLREQIKRGRPGRRMPAWGELEGGLRDEEIIRVAEYVRNLGGIAFEGDAKPRRWIQGSAADGQRLFAAACARCHGERGEGKEGPALNNRVFLDLATDTYLVKTIQNGRPGTSMKDYLAGKFVVASNEKGGKK